MEFVSVNPATGQHESRWPLASAEQRDDLLRVAQAAAGAARATTMGERSGLLRAVARQLRDDAHELAMTATREMGKPLAESLAEVDKCAAGCDYFAEHGPGMLADEALESDAEQAYSSYLPLGLILAIMPWNYPYWQVFRHVAPAVMAGNAVLIKHAENTLGVAHAIVTAFRAAGAPDGLVSTVVCSVEEAGGLITSPQVAAVTLTGSTRAGAVVAATAGSVWKKTVLELGGSDAFVVLEDADVTAAAEMAVRARFQNAGQSCIAAKRFIVVAAVAEAFTEAFVAGARALTVGDPTAPDTTVGPMARSDLRDQLAGQLAEAIAGGARELVIGGPRPGPGFFFAPAVLTVTDRRSPVWAQETFGPVAPIMTVADEQEAVDVANDSDYGLGGSVWTADLDRGRAFARRADSGAVFINGMTASDPRLPFGGVKRSGYGRELSTIGAREFTNVQTVVVRATGGPGRT